MDTHINVPAIHQNHRKRLGGPDARFVAKKSQKVLHSSSSSRSSVSQHSTRSPEITTQGLQGIYPQKTAKYPKLEAGWKPYPDARVLTSVPSIVGQKIGSTDDKSCAPDASSSSETEKGASPIKTREDDVRHGMNQEDSKDTRILSTQPLVAKALQTETLVASLEQDPQPQLQVQAPVSSMLNERPPQIQPLQNDPLVARFSKGVVLEKPRRTTPKNIRPVDSINGGQSSSKKITSTVTEKILSRGNSESSISTRPQITKVLPVINKRKIEEISLGLPENTLKGATPFQSTKDVATTHSPTRVKLIATQQPICLPQQLHPGANSCNGIHDSVSPTKGLSSPALVKPQSKKRVEASRKARESRRLRFDPAAFDTMIYKQSSLRPPATVRTSPRSLAKATTSSEGNRIAAPVNPAVHGMYSRSEEWRRRKEKEIEDRGGRKAWFGKAVERMHKLRSQETAREENRESALEQGAAPPRRDPQPWSHQRVLDFGDVMPEDLPDDVKSNLPWLKACAWMRQSRQNGIEHHRGVLRTTEETTRYYMDVMRGLSRQP